MLRLRRTDYRPAWLDDLADDVTMEASVLNGIVRVHERLTAPACRASWSA
ncbi:MAG TPA: hypothetical protein VHF06_04585 [Pseudonocardiaceae bacterium]|jgi:hypothetical protein|nr:hypothetical protein [Pseudonocardiaceae bacterium]